MPLIDTVAASVRRQFSLLGNHEKRIRNLERNTSRPLETTDGGTSIDPTNELFIGSGLSLADLGSGVAEISLASESITGFRANIDGGAYTFSGAGPS